MPEYRVCRGLYGSRREKGVTPMRILIVEDEVRLAEALSQIMAEQRYQTDVVYTGSDGLDYALTSQYDVIVLDVMLPGLNGFEVVRRLRAAHNSTPVLMLTAKDETADKVTGLDCGADDYMTKPFDPEELMARIRALTRCLSRGEKSVRLGFKEFEVMKLLLANASAVVPKDDIITRVWGLESDAEDNNVEVYVSFLRKKLAFLDSVVQIRTMRKVGYFLEYPAA